MICKSELTGFAKIFIVVFVVTIMGNFSSCNNETPEISNPQQNNESNRLKKEEFFDKNVVFADARIRSISSVEYIKEIVLINFSEEDRMPNSIIFNETTFFDDGSYNDLKPNDGIYSSAAIFPHCKMVPYDKELNLKSVMEKMVIDFEFQHADKIRNISEIYVKPNSSSDGIFKVGKILLDCDIEFGTCGCRADKWGWCDCCCFTLSNCHITVGFEW
ncbi:MAG: hypothetical protein GF417_11935 [Candidatus Latescibacteria bacterium]|nr:hypothetical protein [Candidatus Latescibacterota bacterium]